MQVHTIHINKKRNSCYYFDTMCLKRNALKSTSLIIYHFIFRCEGSSWIRPLDDLFRIFRISISYVYGYLAHICVWIQHVCLVPEKNRKWISRNSSDKQSWPTTVFHWTSGKHVKNKEFVLCFPLMRQHLLWELHILDNNKNLLYYILLNAIKWEALFRTEWKHHQDIHPLGKENGIHWQRKRIPTQ